MPLGTTCALVVCSNRPTEFVIAIMVTSIFHGVYRRNYYILTSLTNESM